jgi:hypothetical protein
MKSKNKKLVYSLLILLLLIGGGVFYVTTLINEEVIRKEIIKAAQRSLPATHVALDKIEYDLGFSLLFRLTNLTVDLKAKKDYPVKRLFQVKKINASIPIWSILTKTGTVKVDIVEPEVTLFKTKTSVNWKDALEKPGSSKNAQTNLNQKSREKEESPEKLPKFLDKIFVDLRLINLHLFYDLFESGKGKLTVEKILIKHINVQSKIAFELASKVEFISSQGLKSSGNVLTVGSFDLKSYMETQNILSDILLKINQLDYDGTSLPPITGNFALSVLSKNNLTLKSELTLAEQSQVMFFLSQSQETLSVTGLKGSLNLNELGLSTLQSNPELREMINLGNASLNFKGNIDYNFKEGKPKIELLLENSKPIGLKTELGVVDSLVKLEFKESFLKANVKQKFLEGDINSSIELPFDIMTEKLSLENLGPYKLSINAEGIRLKSRKLEELLASETAAPQAPSSSPQSQTSSNSVTPQSAVKDKKTVQSVVKEKKPILLPKGEISLLIQPLFVDETEVSINGKIATGLNQVSSERIQFNYEDATADLSFETQMKKKTLTRFKLDFKNLHLGVFKPFYPKEIKNVKGIAKGDSQGFIVIEENKPPHYEVIASFEATQGELEGLNLTNIVKGFISEFSFINKKIKKDSIVYNDKFKLLQVQVKANQQRADIKNFKFVGVESNEVEATLQGHVFTQGNQLSELNMTIKDKGKKLSPLMLKNMGTSLIPIKLTGPGVDLSPDYGFTLKKLGRKALKTQKKKQVKKLVKKAKKKILENKEVRKALNNKKLKKVFEKNNIDTNKVLEGIFK